MLERATQTIVNQVEAMKNMVNDFRDYARTPLPQLGALDLAACSARCLASTRVAAVIAVTPAPTSLPPVLADANAAAPGAAQPVLTNAQDALARGRRSPDRDLTAQDAGRVAADGQRQWPGLSRRRFLARAFEPYVTTKAKGTGLGLAIVKKIVDEHGGEIRLANAIGVGAQVSIWLPLAEKAQECGRGKHDGTGS
jgi:nitrogen fixation/metabolism regulation signal transduction histidine kinase